MKKLFLAIAPILLLAMVLSVSASAFDEFGYNYQANVFVGKADGVDRILDGLVWIKLYPQTHTPLVLNFRFINDKLNQLGYLGRARLEWRIMSDPNILYVCPEFSEKLYPNKGKFTVEQLLKADMVKSAFSAGKRVEHMWVKVSEVQVENHLVKGTLEDTPTEIKHLTFGNIVFVPFKDIEDIWIEGQVPESVKRLLEIKEEELRAEEFVRSLFEGVETISSACARCLGTSS